MVKYILKNKLLFVGLHLVIGALGTLPLFPTLFCHLCIFAFLLLIIISNNKNEEALLFSAYIAGGEVFFRMTSGFFLYETGKYSVMLFLLIGMFQHIHKLKISVSYLIYLLVLLIGIVFTEVPEGQSLRKSILFNLSGPIVLAISSIYFYKRVIIKKQLYDALYFMLLPNISVLSYLYLRTPNIKEIAFAGAANFEASGGFGPNQVATAIGLAIFIIGVFFLVKRKLTGILILDALFLAYFIYRGLLTFSRGGMITGVFALICFSLFYGLSQKNSSTFLLKYVLVGITFSLAVWIYTSGITGGMLDNRYTGKNAKGIQKEDISSGRIAIFESQLASLLESPLGIGVGNGKYKRLQSEEHITAASHNEIGRLIEEHGFLGVLILFILFFTPVWGFIDATNFQRGFLLAFFLLWFLTINHSAMRIAFPGFIYGLCLINLIDDEEE